MSGICFDCGGTAEIGADGLCSECQQEIAEADERELPAPSLSDAPEGEKDGQP